MSEHRKLIQRKLEHLDRMRGCLEYSRARVAPVLQRPDGSGLGPEQHETLAAFRVRFSEFSGAFGQDDARSPSRRSSGPSRPVPSSSTEKLGIIESTERWRLIREPRNAVNQEYEDNAERLATFFLELARAAPELLDCHNRLVEFVESHYTAVS